MMQTELRRRLRDAGYPIELHNIPRLAARALNSPQTGRPIGNPGHRKYSERDYRRIVAWLRVHKLCGDERQVRGRRLRREAVELLAANAYGYVWISNGEVGWSALPPVGVLRAGVATCWPVQE